jgi:hypothetical protein
VAYFAERDSKAMLHHIFALTVLEDYLYWTDWETKAVRRCRKYNGTDCSTLATTVHRPMDIHVYHPLRQVQGEVGQFKFCCGNMFWYCRYSLLCLGNIFCLKQSPNIFLRAEISHKVVLEGSGEVSP